VLVIALAAPASSPEIKEIEKLFIFLEDEAVAGNTAVITPEFAEWVTEVAPATVKKLAVTPVNVYPEVAVRMIVAV
jgi:hypothetical protein